MKQLLKFFKPFYGQLLALVALYGVQTVCVLFMPYVMSSIVEDGIRKQALDVVLQQSMLMMALAVFSLVCALITNRLNSKLMSRFSVNIRRQLFEKVNTLTFEQFSEVGTGSLITRTTDDIGWMEETIAQLPYVISSVPIMFIGGIVLSFKGDWLLPLILLGVSAVVLFAATKIASSVEKYWKRADEFTDQQNRIIRERLSGIRVIRAFNKEDHEHRRAEYATTEMCKAYVRSNIVGNIIMPLASLVFNLATVAIIYIGAVRLQTEQALRAGDIIATIQYIALIINAILILSWTFAFIPHVNVSMNRIGNILNMPCLRAEPSMGKKLGGSVTFRNVSFAYGGAGKALQNVSFDIAEGETVGVIGGTGSGKTTLVKLIMDFYDADGDRFFGGVNYADLTPATVRDNVSVALQKSMIFEGTVEENVKMGNPDASEQQVREALEIAQLSDFVNSHEEGLQYLLKQAGSNVSGGQKQRINIARAILKDASLYIFDDSFSALDFLTESNLRRALNRYLDGKTQIIVTQRAATAMRCDRVYVLDEGKVVGVGTHAELLQNCSVYREIYNSQLGGDVDE